MYRARYRTETAETNKGQLRDQEKEPVSIGVGLIGLPLGDAKLNAFSLVLPDGERS